MKLLDEKLKKILILIFGLIIFIIIVALIINVFKGSSLSYEGMEEKMVEATKSYLNANKNKRPVSEDDSVVISDSTLSSGNYMKPLKEYQKKSTDSCTGHVTVTMVGSDYTYSPYLDCGDSYTTTYLYEKLISNLVSSGDGLYAMDQVYNGKTNKVYVFKGENPQNLISFDGKKYRIVKIDENNNLMLIESQPSTSVDYSNSWDNRYNGETKDYSGLDDFDASRIKITLQSLLNNKTIVPESLKNVLISKKLCIGDRSINQKKNDGSIECKKLSSEKEYIGLLTVYDYNNASLDSNCKKIEDRYCGNYNYLSRYGREFWLLNTNSVNTYRGFAASSYVYRKTLSENATVRPVVYISSNVVYKSGTGTGTNPYIIK